ncbi:MAG: ribonuclease P protein component [Pseudomonadota bacterium]
MTHPDAFDAPRPSQPTVIRNRRDFVACARARRHTAAGLLLQARLRCEVESACRAARVGYTCSRKIGNAVTRNRAKRRLRAAAAQVLPEAGRPGYDYVLIGRPGATVERPFDALLADLRLALEKVHAPARPRRGAS